MILVTQYVTWLHSEELYDLGYIVHSIVLYNLGYILQYYMTLVT